MQTKILSPEDLSEPISFLKEGIPIAFPTETVYGLGARLDSESAIQKIFTIKGRPSDNPLIAHVAFLSQVELLALDIPQDFFKLTEKFWPGPLTLVVKKKPSVLDAVSGGLSSVGIRMPSHIVALRLIEAVGPLAAPSANLSGRPSPTSAFDVFEDLEGKIPCIIDGGECALGMESTVLSLLGNTPVLLRLGSLGKEEIEEVLKKEVFFSKKEGPILSPGMRYRHYAPQAKVTMILDPKNLEGEFILSLTPRFGQRLLSEKTLYSELRKADRLGISEIKIDCTETVLQNKVLMDRLEKICENP